MYFSMEPVGWVALSIVIKPVDGTVELAEEGSLTVLLLYLRFCALLVPAADGCHHRLVGGIVGDLWGKFKP